MFSVWYWRRLNVMARMGFCSDVYEALELAACMRGWVEHNGKTIWSAEDGE